MKTYICYKVDWDDNGIFYVCHKNTNATERVFEEYYKYKSYGYYIEVWKDGNKINTYVLNKDKMELEIDIEC